MAEAATAPAAPDRADGHRQTASSVSLSWTAPTGTVTGYNVYENGTKACRPPATSATVTGLAASTTYSFAVTADNSRRRVGQVRRGLGDHLVLGRRRRRRRQSGSFAVAPYVDMTNNQEPMLN